MASTGDDGSETDSVPDDVFQRSSSAVGGAEQEELEEVQYAQTRYEGERVVPQRHQQDSDDGSLDDHNHQDGRSEEHYYSDEDDERENRFEGPTSTWRFYTESERNLAASLDQERANDLSVHLYNAHALKAGSRDSEAAAQAKHHQDKKHWVKAKEDGTLPWHTDAHWTAWPLKSEHVPRKGEAFGVPVPLRDEEQSTFRKPVDWKPSLDFEEEIQAIMMREAKVQLLQHRNYAPPQSSSLLHVAAAQSSPRKRKRSSGYSSTHASSSDRDSEPSGPELDRHDSPAQNSGQSLGVLIDDDEAVEVLQPAVRHIISKLDDLLLGLHKSRQRHVKGSASPRSRSRYEGRKSRDRVRSKSGTGEGQDVDDADDQAANASERKTKRASRPQTTSRAASSAETDAPQEEKKAKRKPPLIPRDWSEVLGIASMVGWNAEVIKRASERCSSLFGERMTFQEAHKTPAGEGEDNEARRNLIDVEEEAEEGYSCPVESCPRHTEPWPLKKTWRWREHLKRSHKYSKAEVERLEERLRAEKAGAGGGDPEDAAKETINGI